MLTGHRGGLGVGTHFDDGVRYTENTVPAFRRALDHYGLCAVETDLRRTCDHVLVLNHDNRWNRTTNARGRVRLKCSAYVARHQADSGAPIATYESFLAELASTGSCYRQIELKARLRKPDLLAMLALNERWVKDPSCLLYVSSSRDHLALLDSLNSQVATGWVVFDDSLPNMSQVPRFIDLVMVDSRAVTAEYVAAAHARGVMVSARRVGTPEALAAMAEMGVDRVQTDDAAALTAAPPSVRMTDE